MSTATTGHTRENGNGSWKTALIAGLWALLMAVVGWDVTAATTARAKMSDDLATDTQRIAVLEERDRAIEQSQQRIEALLNEIRAAQIEAMRARK